MRYPLKGGDAMARILRTLALSTLCLSVSFCSAGASAAQDPRQDRDEGLDRPYQAARKRMVKRQIRARGVKDPAVLRAMERVERHRLVPKTRRHSAYADGPLPIGHGQTISQPYIVALMTERLRLSPGDRVLEVGTGSGYQAAVLAEIVSEVFSIEIYRELHERAKENLKALGYETIRLRHGDGARGWKEEAPFDAIIVTCAASHIPPALVEQLKPGGRICIPVGAPFGVQRLLLVEKGDGSDAKVRTRTITEVRFVPLLAPRDLKKRSRPPKDPEEREDPQEKKPGEEARPASP
ncbi:MAG: protein-L-isoaspartate(D-aspartate) O-methyltransferase [Planctomycetota bacterium]